MTPFRREPVPTADGGTGNERPRVVIVGGGFGGLYCARALKKAPVRVTVIDRRNYHLFQPLLYQVATASLSPADIASPIRAVVGDHANTEVWMGEVTGVDLESRMVQLEDAQVDYDYLVVATGATHSYFGHEEWEPSAPGLKTVDDALEIRRRFLLAFEAAEREADPEARRRLLTFVIIGAGPTGVELAGAMAEIARRSIPGDFRFIDTTTARIVLVEGMDRVLPPYPPALSDSARRQLESLGVEVRTDAMVTAVDERGVTIGQDEEAERIDASNVFWAAGVAASPLGSELGETDRAGRVRVGEDCTIPGHPEVFVIGDLARFEQDGENITGAAPAAMQMGRYAARTIEREVAGRAREPFRYTDKGSLATIGRAAAVARIWKLELEGLIAWLIWVFVHIAYLIGFRNRILVMTQWAWAWLSYQRGIRLITGERQVALARSRGGRRDDEESQGEGT